MTHNTALVGWHRADECVHYDVNVIVPLSIPVVTASTAYIQVRDREPVRVRFRSWAQQTGKIKQ